MSEVIVLLPVFISGLLWMNCGWPMSCCVGVAVSLGLESTVGVAAAFLFDDASCFAPVQAAVVVSGVGAKGVGGVVGE